MAGQDQRPLKPATLKVLLMCGIIAPILYAIARKDCIIFNDQENFMGGQC
jgi:hypothetical protein